MSMQGATGFVVETSGLTKRFGDRVAVDNVELRVPRGSAFGYLGPNGAGKTTLIRMLLGLTHATAGTMRLLGRPVPDERAAALARVGAIVEEPRFHGHLTGRENLTVIAAAREPEAHDRIDGALARVGLSQRADERVKRYSLGMRQRLGVARSLLADPELLILDEPTNGLDPAGIHEFRDMIRGFVAEGRTVLLSSHLLDEVEKICDEVAIVDQGKVVVQGSIAELAAGGKQTILIATSDEERALAILSEHRGVKSAIAEAQRHPRHARRRFASRRRTTSAAVSSWRGWPFAASSRRACRSSSGSWRSRPDWRKQHEHDASLHELRGRAAGRRWRPRLVSAEFLKLRKRRGLVISTLALTVLPMIIGYTVLLSIHAANPAKHGPAGGLENLSGSMDMLSTLSVVAAILVGATLGAGDLGSGVFRELVVTGRSRLALFAARVPARPRAPLAVRAAQASRSRRSARSCSRAPSVRPAQASSSDRRAWLALVTARSPGARPRGLLDDRLARHDDRGRPGLADRRRAGVAPDQGARGSARRARRRRDRPHSHRPRSSRGSPKVSPSIGAAVLVIAVWTVVPLAVGAWRTCTRDA